MLWVPSQKGFDDDEPHRQRAIFGFPLVSILAPVASQTSTSPSTSNGPFGRTLIFTVIDWFLLWDGLSAPKIPSRATLGP